jgi:GMP synthase-like glutamine amidotransferase
MLSAPLKLHCLQHAAFEGPSLILDWAKARGHSFQLAPLFEKSHFPSLGEFDGLIVMGGPMGVYDNDRFPWLDQEIALIAEAIKSGKKVLGVCLGAQLIAAALNSRVYPHSEKEIGWFNVEKTGSQTDLFRDFPSPCKVLHWHGDTFELPKGAVHVLRSKACENQAFVYGSNVLALQFHLETTRASLQGMVDALHAEVEDNQRKGARHVQSVEEILNSASEAARLEPILFRTLDLFFECGP